MSGMEGVTASPPQLSLSFDLGEGLVETGRIRNVLNLKLEKLHNSLSRLSLRFDSIAEMHMREHMRMKWEKGLPECRTRTPAVPDYVANPASLPLPSSLDFFRQRDAVGQQGHTEDAGARQYDKRRPICRRASMHRPRELEYERPEWRQVPNTLPNFISTFRAWRQASSRGIAALKRKLKEQEEESM